MPGHDLETKVEGAFLYMTGDAHAGGHDNDCDTLTVLHYAKKRRPEAWEAFSAAWEDRYGLRKFLLNGCDGRWQLLPVEVLLGAYETHELRDCFDPNAAKRISEIIGKKKASGVNLVARTQIRPEKPYVYEVSATTTEDELILSYGSHGFTNKQCCWAIKERSCASASSSPFFIEIPGPGFPAFYRAALLVQNQCGWHLGIGAEEKSTVVFLDWLFTGEQTDVLQTLFNFFNRKKHGLTASGMRALLRSMGCR